MSMVQAIGMIETKGLCALLEASDAALKAANVTLDRLGKDRQRLRDRLLPGRCRGREGRHRRRRGRRRPGGPGHQRARDPPPPRRPARPGQVHGAADAPDLSRMTGKTGLP